MLSFFSLYGKGSANDFVLLYYLASCRLLFVPTVGRLGGRMNSEGPDSAVVVIVEMIKASLYFEEQKLIKRLIKSI